MAYPKIVAALAGIATLGGLAWWASQPAPRMEQAREERLSEVTGQLARSLEELEATRKRQLLHPDQNSTPLRVIAQGDSAGGWGRFAREHGLEGYESELRSYLGDSRAQTAARQLLVLNRAGDAADRALGWSALARIDEDPMGSMTDLSRALDEMPGTRDARERTYLLQLVGRLADSPVARAQAIELLRTESERGTRSPTDTQAVSTAGFAYLQLMAVSEPDAAGLNPPSAVEDPALGQLLAHRESSRAPASAANP